MSESIFAFCIFFFPQMLGLANNEHIKQIHLDDNLERFDALVGIPGRNELLVEVVNVFDVVLLGQVEHGLDVVLVVLLQRFQTSLGLVHLGSIFGREEARRDREAARRRVPLDR